MQLSIPIFYKDEIFDQCEIRKPKAGVLASTYEIFQNKDDFSAILELLSKSILWFKSTDEKIIDSPDQIRAICRKMPYITAEVISTKIMLLINKDDWIEGVYPCPRCGHLTITGIDHDTFEDTRDRIEDLEIINQSENEDGELLKSEYSNIIHLNLVEPIEIKQLKTDYVLHKIESIDLRFPNLDDCIKGSNKYPNNKEIKRQFAIYAEAIEKINGEDVKIKWQKIWGEFIFREMDTEDLELISIAMQMYGIQKTLRKTCKNCQKTWKAEINTSNFFVSGLQSM
jgi:hypothetical protein